MNLKRREFLALGMMLGWPGGGIESVGAAPAAAGGTDRPTPFFLEPGVAIVVSESEPAPVRRAAADLARDLEAVLGAPSPLVGEAGALRGRPGIVVAGPGSATGGLRHPAVKGWESHGVYTREVGGAPCVVLHGADVRGTIYAIYTFSERALGIPPLWVWASHVPRRRGRIEVDGSLETIFPTPHVKWRAWFPNDEDLFTPWRGQAPENYDAHLETMLRLKLNTLEGRMLAAENFKEKYSVNRTTRAAQERGLAVTGHHIYALGSSLGDWGAYWRGIKKRPAPPLTIANKAALEEFWQYHIETALHNRLEVVWQISFRGNGDIPFWETYEDAPAEPAERARVIAAMMQTQVALLKRVTGDPAPVMRTTLYNENSDFFAAGLMRPPDEPTLIWNFVAARRDHYPAEDIRRFAPGPARPIGYYLNFQFTSTGAHLAQAEGPWKMERNFRMVGGISPRPLEFAVVNMGNIREFVLEGAANARMMWDWDGYSSDGFLKEFCAQYFGPSHAARIAGLYRDFFNSYWEPKKPELPGFERQFVFQDMRYARAAEQMLAALAKGGSLNPLKDRANDASGRTFRITPADSGAASQMEAMRLGTAAAIKKLEPILAACDVLLPEVEESGRTFLCDNLQVQTEFMLELNRTLNALARALETPASASACLAEALAASRRLPRVLAQAEHGRFASWYAGDRLFGLKKLAQGIERAMTRK